MTATRSTQAIPHARRQPRAWPRRLLILSLSALAGLSLLSFVGLHQAPLPEEMILLAVADWYASPSERR